MPEVPAVPRRAGLTARGAGDLRGRAAAIFAPDGPLARALPDFEPRAGQVQMAAAVAHALESGGVLLAEAGTGTGKTLGYLVPAILSGQRVLVSTGTKNLQEQIFFKDVPALRTALDVPFTATLMKGRANYLCLHRLDQLLEGSSAASYDVFLPIIRDWAARTETGDRGEIEDLPEDLPFWGEVAATADTCLGAECPRFDACFVTRMRQRAAESDIVIVNHHLLCADAAVRQNAFGEVIPACHTAIIDEAHQLEDIATQYFGVSVSTYRMEELAHDAGRIGTEAGPDIAQAVETLRAASRSFFAELATAHRAGDPGRGRGAPAERPRNDERVRVTAGSLSQAAGAADGLTAALRRLETALGFGPGRKAAAGEDVADEDREALARRARELGDEIRFLLRAADPGFVYYVEFRGKGVFLRASPIDVSTIMHDVLFDKMRATVLTSATLTIDGTFEYVRNRLGIASAAEIRLPSEFDFGRQAVLYLPRRMPDPRSPDFALAAAREVIAILQRTRGRAFVLFTSYAALRTVQALAEMALEYPIFVQGTAPRTQLLAQFRSTPNAVLFATASFWQGVDVAGEALSCVIVDKLPFASPGDPITSARIEAIRARGGGAFDEYQVPIAILALKQGLGRLIRHRRDRGVLAVLDPRLQTMGYGRRFLASLPPAPIVRDVAAIDAFFSIV